MTLKKLIIIGTIISIIFSVLIIMGIHTCAKSISNTGLKHIGEKIWHGTNR